MILGFAAEIEALFAQSSIWKYIRCKQIAMRKQYKRSVYYNSSSESSEPVAGVVCRCTDYRVEWAERRKKVEDFLVVANSAACRHTRKATSAGIFRIDHGTSPELCIAPEERNAMETVLYR